MWALFAIMLAVEGYLALAACDLGIKPLFGLRYCKVDESPGALADELARRRQLLARLQEAELKKAQTPICEPPPPPHPPPPPPAPDDGSKDELKIPQHKEELEGCWQSVRGDIPFYTDDEKRAFTGSARICYCFAKNGRGTIRQTYLEGQGPAAGAVCQTRLKAVLKPGELLLEHPEVPCTKGGNVNAATIICRSTEDGTASCELTYKSRIPENPSTEKFRRVPNEYCGWRPGR